MKFSLSLILFAALLLQSGAKQNHPNYVLDRTPAQGKLWLSWSTSEREKFILGYLWAYHRGFSSACQDYFEASPPKTLDNVKNSPLQKCMLQELHYSQSVTYYERRITGFYGKFPDAADESLSWLIQAFSDSEGQTDDELLAARSRGHAHP